MFWFFLTEILGNLMVYKLFYIKGKSLQRTSDKMQAKYFITEIYGHIYCYFK